MTQTNDGFVIAEKDLQIRGPGEFLGTRQSGLPDMIIADLVADSKILELAGLKKEDLTPIYDALKQELSNLPKDYKWSETDINKRMDKYLEENGIE